MYRPVSAESVRAALDLQSKLAMEERPLVRANSMIEGFRASSTRPVVGETVYFEGYVKWHLWPCWWFGVEGERCLLLVDEVEVASTTTGKEGYFKFAHLFKTTGRYWVKAKYPGSLLVNPCESLPIEVTVLTEEQKREEELRFLLFVGGVGAVAVIGLVGVVLYAEEARRRELMLAALRR